MTPFHSRSRVSRADVRCSTPVVAVSCADAIQIGLLTGRGYICGRPRRTTDHPSGAARRTASSGAPSQPRCSSPVDSYYCHSHCRMTPSRGLKQTGGPDSFGLVVSALLSEQAHRVITFSQQSGEQAVSCDVPGDHLHDVMETAADRDQIALEPTHVTLPKLDDVGLVEDEHQRRAVRYREPS